MASSIRENSALRLSAQIRSSKAEDTALIDQLPNEILFEIFRFATRSRAPGDIQTLHSLCSVSLKWRSIANIAVPQLFWIQLRYFPLPSFRPSIRQAELNIQQQVGIKNFVEQVTSSALQPGLPPEEILPYSVEQYYDEQFSFLTEKLKHLGIPIPEGTLVLRPESYAEYQRQLDMSLEIIWSKVQEELDFEEAFIPNSAKEVRKWLADQTHLEAIRSVSTLDLSSLELKLLPPEIGDLIGLTELKLSDNEIRALPFAIGKLRFLSKLELQDNWLSSLPPSIGDLSSLTVLDLSFNYLTAIPETIGSLGNRLEIFHLSDNQLQTLPPSIERLSSLTQFDLSGNELTSLPATIGNLTSLKILQLGKNRLTELPESCRYLTSVTNLSLDEELIANVPVALGHFSSLKWAEVHNEKGSIFQEF